jgi:putative Ca2+/H+ antiporter (TMEM165/GDT1 family)
MKEGGGAVAVLFLAGFAALWPRPMAWAYVVAFMVFEFWLLRRLKRAGSAPAAVGEAPYHFTEEEAAFIGRFRLYFTYPQIARGAASTLAALGLSALVLSPWLVFRGELLPAGLVALNILAVGTLTRRLAPLMVLRVAAHKGDRQALRMLELHDPLWEKIRAANAARG